MQAAKKLFHSKKYHNKILFLGLQSIFIGLTLLITGYILTRGLLDYVTSFDSADHVQEAQEIAFDISHLKWPEFTYTYGIPGSAMPTYYPWVSFLALILADILKLRLVTGIRLAFVLVFYLTYNVIFYSAKSYWHDVTKSLWFTVLVSMTPFLLEVFDGLKDYAFATAIPFMVMATFGWLHWVKDNRWRMLSVSIIFLVYDNFVSAYITILSLGLITITMPKILAGKDKIISAIKAAVVTVLVTALVWVPILYLKCTNNIDIPMHEFANDNLHNNYAYTFAPIMDIIVIIILLLRVKKLSWLDKRIFIISIFLAICNCHIIPLKLMAHTPLVMAQLAWRYWAPAHIFLMLVWAPILVKMIRFPPKESYIRAAVITYLGIFGLSCIVILLQNNLLNENRPAYSLKGPQATVTRVALANFKQLDTKRPRNAFRGRFYIGEYMPQDILQANGKGSLFKHTLNTDFKYSYFPDLYYQQYFEQHHIKCINDGIEFTQKHGQSNKQVPLTLYHGQSYRIYDNGHRVHQYRHRCHELVLPKVTKGTHRITFNALVMWYRYSAALISAGSVLIWAIIDWKKRKDNL